MFVVVVFVGTHRLVEVYETEVLGLWDRFGGDFAIKRVSGRGEGYLAVEWVP